MIRCYKQNREVILVFLLESNLHYVYVLFLKYKSLYLKTSDIMRIHMHLSFNVPNTVLRNNIINKMC
jgi:hypothetical protein